MKYLEIYWKTVPKDRQTSQAIAFIASLDAIEETSPTLARSILQELFDQRTYLKMIASENYSSLKVQLAMGNLLTDKYSEGSIGKRFYAGCENVDAIEAHAASLAEKLYGVEHAYLQPHSGADANLIAFLAILKVCVQDPYIQYLGKKLQDLSEKEYASLRELLFKQKMMGMALSSGGHLTHGYRHNISSKLLSCSFYEVDPKTGLLDYEQVEKRVLKEKPLILIAGYSSYSRKIDFAKMRAIADEVGAILLVDMAHFSGLVAGKVFSGKYDPTKHAHILTSTTHKTLRGPRGGMILLPKNTIRYKPRLKEAVDQVLQELPLKEAVDQGCPQVIGGPLPHVIAAKGLAFQEALAPEFALYSQQVVKNAKALASCLQDLGAKVITGGTENHMVLVDVQTSYGITGKAAEAALRKAQITINRNAIPEDQNGPWYTSGIRLGTPAMTTLGMKEDEMQEIGKAIHALLQTAKPVFQTRGVEKRLMKSTCTVDPRAEKSCAQVVSSLLKKHPLYPELPSNEELCQTI